MAQVLFNCSGAGGEQASGANQEVEPVCALGDYVSSVTWDVELEPLAYLGELTATYTSDHTERPCMDDGRGLPSCTAWVRQTRIRVDSPGDLRLLDFEEALLKRRGAELLDECKE